MNVFAAGVANRVLDLYSGSSGSSPSYMTPFNGKLYFGADANDGHGRELWSYDGTTAILAADIRSGIGFNGWSNPQYLAVYNGKLYFSANGGDGAGTELWSFDGTTASRVADIYPGTGNSLPSYLAVYDGKLYFSADDGSGSYGNELYSYDGVSVSLTADINPGSSGSAPAYLAVYKGKLYFQANNELYSYDGSSASLVADINLGGYSNPGCLTVFNGTLYFRANGGDGAGTELWSYDGSTSPSRVADIYSGSSSSVPDYLVVYNEKLFFAANGGDGAGTEIWSYDGSTAPQRVVDIISGSGSSNPQYLVVYGSSLYFSADGNDGAGRELWKYFEELPPKVLSTTPGNGSTVGAISNLEVVFNKDMTHDGGADAADNVDNFILVEAKDNGFQTTACNATDFTNDTRITVNSAVYSNNSGAGPFKTALSVNSGVNLPTGSYRLLVCGTTSVTDLSGNEINDGTDEVVNFIVVIGEQVEFMPETGFTPGRTTFLPQQPEITNYEQAGEIRLSIPVLGIDAPIVGVPISNDGWDLTWLGTKVGWLYGTAFPSWSGNSTLAGHVFDANGQPGIFRDLATLKWGDEITVYLYGQPYQYEVRRVYQYIEPGDTSLLFKHEDLPWLTLITCRGYDDETDSYRYRVVVRAVQVRGY